MNVWQGLEFVDFIGIGRVAWGVPGLSARAVWQLRQRVGKEAENGSVPLLSLIEGSKRRSPDRRSPLHVPCR
jgi:hypothetical protein